MLLPFSFLTDNKKPSFLSFKTCQDILMHLLSTFPRLLFELDKITHGGFVVMLYILAGFVSVQFIIRELHFKEFLFKLNERLSLYLITNNIFV